MDRPYAYRIENGIAWIVVEGDQDIGRMTEVQERLASDPAFYPDIPKLIDGRRVTNWMSTADIVRMRELTDRVHADAKTTRRVAMVSSDAMVEKITRLSQVILDHGPQSGRVGHRYFSSVTEALDWLRETRSTP